MKCSNLHVMINTFTLNLVKTNYKEGIYLHQITSFFKNTKKICI
jgi:hypothetical protein